MENKQKVIICRGLPASGKSTWSDEFIKENPQFVKIEKDHIRKDGRLFKDGTYNHKRGDESIVIRERDRLIRHALEHGKSVISSDTNLVQKHISQISALARKYNVDIEVKSFLDVPISELISRDSKREDAVGAQVIRRMFHDHVKRLPTFYKYNPDLPFVVVCDLDGTLTKGPKDRSPYDWFKVGNDDINLGVSHVLDGIRIIDYCKIFIFSGRDEVCRPQTEDWLERHDIEYDLLAMRPESDNRSDEIIKAEMIEEHIKDKYNVLIWFDDRNRIATMLRDVYGFNVAQMGDVNWNF